MAEARQRPAGLSSVIPVQRAEVRATESLMLELAPSPRGALWEAVEAAILALEDARAQTP